MSYDQFLKLLEELDSLPSFNQKIHFADQHLNRIGSGSGRIVYDIDGNKVLKLAKNKKGIAQNQEEINIAGYHDNEDIITKIYEYDENGSWIVAEKAKKVTSKRIKELTGIPNLNTFGYYLLNILGSHRGFHIDDNVKESLDNNEWAQEVLNFAGNYGQHVGDFRRPSSYSEVNRDGTPQIVITDYGLSDEVYSTHYSPQRNQRYRMYELHDMNRGGIYHEFTNGEENRKAFWALQPYNVSDGQGVINERLLNFLENKDLGIIRRPIFTLTSLVENFHDVVNNLPNYLNKATDKKVFYENLLKIQEYLKKKGLYDRDELLYEEQEFSNDIPVKKWSLEKEDADKLANFLTNELQLGSISYLGGGGYGYAYRFGDKVLKITSDPSEADAALKTQRAKPNTLAAIYNVYKITDRETNKAYFVIIQEFIENKPVEKFSRYNEIINTIADATGNPDIITIVKKARKNFNYDEFLKRIEYILNAGEEMTYSDQERKEAYQYMVGLLNIQKDLTDLGIKSDDYTTINNLGYRDGNLVFLMLVVIE